MICLAESCQNLQFIPGLGYEKLIENLPFIDELCSLLAKNEKAQMKVVHEQFEMIDTNFEALSVAVNIGSYDKRLNSSIQEHLISGIVKR